VFLQNAFVEGLVRDNPLLDVLNRELASAGDGLVGNGEVLRGILSGSDDCIKILDLDGRLQFMSEGGRRVMEVENFESLKGCPWPDFWAGDGNTQAHDAVAAAKAGRTTRFRNAASTAKGTPRHWEVQVSPILGEGGAPSHLLCISRDITEEWQAAHALKDAAARHQFLTEELTHRVKNTLATVLAIANQSFRGEEYKTQRDVFNARIRSLSDAYNILTETSWTATVMNAVVEAALAPYRSSGQISIAGPDHPISPKQALTLALAVNELATNAMKYGALSDAAGRVEVRWSLADGALHFEWRESGGPPVTAPLRAGFGSRVINSLLAGDFAGTVAMDYAPGGLVCVLQAPQR
jgi:PAS domain S-box-containing protein